MDIQYIGGADPEMVFLDKDYTEVEVQYVFVCMMTLCGHGKGGWVGGFSFTL